MNQERIMTVCQRIQNQYRNVLYDILQRRYYKLEGVTISLHLGGWGPPSLLLLLISLLQETVV